ncbi:MAG: diaminopimelate decarboxylase, partial [Thermoleophilia bacterium]|nr:diaminopimelate decarboxylase [Thermoleophilia bacterium]
MSVQPNTEQARGEGVSGRAEPDFSEVGPLGPPYPIDARINEAGRLEVGGCDLVDLAKTHGTPAYVFAENDLRARARAAVAAFGPETGVLFASKAFPCTAAYRLMAAEGVCCDVASGGELH